MNIEGGWSLVFDRSIPATHVKSALDLGQALDRIFTSRDDGISITWYKGRIRIPYAYGVSDILDDVIHMLEALSAAQGSDYQVAFSPNDPGGLDADLALTWKYDVLTIDAHWRTAANGLEEDLSEPRRLTMSKCAYAKSWIDALQFLCTAVSGVELELDDEVCTIRRLATLF